MFRRCSLFGPRAGTFFSFPMLNNRETAAFGSYRRTLALHAEGSVVI